MMQMSEAVTLLGFAVIFAAVQLLRESRLLVTVTLDAPES